MPTTRNGYTPGTRGVVLRSIEASLECGTPYNHYSHWEPSVSNEENPLKYGAEVFAHHCLPDGTPLTIEERRYIAGIIINHIKEGE